MYQSSGLTQFFQHSALFGNLPIIQIGLKHNQSCVREQKLFLVFGFVLFLLFRFFFFVFFSFFFSFQSSDALLLLFQVAAFNVFIN